MKEKLEIIRQNEQMNASELAKKLGVEASAISHIRSGRNKPSFDFVVKILAAFPHINPDWLLLDRGPYLREDVGGAAPLPGNINGVDSLDDVPHSGDVTLFDAAENIRTEETESVSKNYIEPPFPLQSKNGKSVERIIVLYSDKSFDSYNPSSR